VAWIQKNPDQTSFKKMVYEKLNADFSVDQIYKFFPDTKDDIIKYRTREKRNKIEDFS